MENDEIDYYDQNENGERRSEPRYYCCERDVRWHRVTESGTEHEGQIYDASLCGVGIIVGAGEGPYEGDEIELSCKGREKAVICEIVRVEQFDEQHDLAGGRIMDEQNCGVMGQQQEPRLNMYCQKGWDKHRNDYLEIEREREIEMRMGMVKQYALRIGRRVQGEFEIEDLISAGVVGLLEAIDNAGAKWGGDFERYCMDRVRCAILDELRRMSWVRVRGKKNAIRRIVNFVDSMTSNVLEYYEGV